MKYTFLLLACSACSFFTTHAQSKQNCAYAITGSTKGDLVWAEIKVVDLNTGEVVQNIVDKNLTGIPRFNARTGKAITNTAAGTPADQSPVALSAYAAACAFDQQHNRLYFTRMFGNELQYVDLDTRTPHAYTFENEALSQGANMQDEANHITRMAITPNGNGYAISNDGNHFIRFTTGKKPVITDLGPLQDDGANGAVSVHNRCTSWGGDMIADVAGDLYVISAAHFVFKINTDTKVATYKGVIEGLPANFTTNGAAIDNEGRLVVSSANSTEGYYRVDMNNWHATRVETNGPVFNTSDLATGNFAFTGNNKPITQVAAREIVRNELISVYPNPVVDRQFRVSFQNKEAGRYNIQLVDLTGRVVAQKVVAIGVEGQVTPVDISTNIGKGILLVKVVNEANKTVYADKLMIAE